MHTHTFNWDSTHALGPSPHDLDLVVVQLVVLGFGPMVISVGAWVEPGARWSKNPTILLKI